MTMQQRNAVKKNGKVLGALEEAIMEVLWRKGSGTVREVCAVVGRRRDIAYTTVMTVMTRLTEKKVLCRKELRDGSFLYTPCESREGFYAKASHTLFSEMVRSFGAVAVAQFVDVLEEVDPKQVEALRERLKVKR